MKMKNKDMRPELQVWYQDCLQDRSSVQLPALRAFPTEKILSNELIILLHRKLH